jgi:acetyl esterase/lipase
MRHSPRRILAVALLATVSAHSPAGEPPPLPDFTVSDRLMPVDPMPERQTHWSHGAVTLTDVVYSTITGFRPLHLDLYRQTGVAAPRPLIVFVHGGGWAYSNPRAGAGFRDFPVVLANLAERGYVVASIAYRLSGEAPFPAQLEDLQAAIRFLRGNAERFGIDGARVGLWGMSAGAQLAALNAVNCATGTCVQGFVGWFGAYDIATYARDQRDDTNVRALFRCGAVACAAEVVDRASPIRYADGTDPPALLIHGQDDTNARSSQSERFAQQLRAAGSTAELVLIPGVQHGFIGPTEAATKDALRLALTATFDFFDHVLKESPAATR